MTDYRRNFIAGGSYFTVNLAERRLRLLAEHIDSAEFVIGPSVAGTRWLGRATKRRTIKCLANDSRQNVNGRDKPGHDDFKAWCRPRDCRSGDVLDLTVRPHDQTHRGTHQQQAQRRAE